ncbi:MAG: hypothetical protein KJ645_10765 [Planctomycetes bacterium]|nr:hypothetical protein [Planctomycetota bacterium]
MMTKKSAGVVLLILGIFFFILSLILDIIGLGSSPGFGNNQIAGAVLGALMIIVGWILTRQK